MSDTHMLNLDRFWNSFLDGDSAETIAIESDVIEAISLFHAAGDVEGPDSKFTSDLWHVLRAGIFDSPGYNYVTGDEIPSARQSVIPADLPVDHEGSRWRPLVAVVAAILLLVAGSFLGARLIDRHDSGQLSTAPTIIAPATPAGPVRTEETLLTFTIPAADVPQGENITSGLTIDIVPVGNRSIWVPYCCPGPHFEYVLSGKYSVIVEVDIVVVRSDGTELSVPAGTAVTLLPGDALVTRNEVPMEAANVGDEPVYLMHWVLIDADGDFGGHDLPGWQVTSFLDVQGPFPLDPSDTVIQLRRLGVFDGDTFTVMEPGRRFIIEGDEAVFLRRPANQPVAVLGDRDETHPIYVLDLTQAPYLPQPNRSSSPIASPEDSASNGSDVNPAH